jgi:hypothetical protein
MDLDRKFQDVTSGNAVKINLLVVDRKYPVTHAESIVTKFGPAALLRIRNTPFDTVKAFMTKRYGPVFGW